MFEFDLDLVMKYDKPGPRYTSYPTAPHFTEEFTGEDLRKELTATNQGEDLPDLSLYFHLPYCDTLCYFCGCNMFVSRDRNRISNYVNYIKKEIDLYKKIVRDDRKAVQLQWGGGTPTHLTPLEIAELSSYINKNFSFRDTAERGCEIDPRELTREHLEALREGGFNRISMGVQDIDAKVQKAVNRIQPEGLTRKVVDWVKELGFESYNLDLMYGLPHQTPESFEKTVDATIDIAPDRIAVFNFAYVPWMKKHQTILNEEDMPKPEVKLEVFKMTSEKLTDAGYVFIGMDHFAKPDDELAVALREKKLYRNFQGYNTYAGSDLYAFGITSIGQFGRIYAQNVKTEKEYYEALDKDEFPIHRGIRLNDDDVLRRDVITRIMCDFELDFKEIEKKYNIDFKQYFAWGLGNLKEMEKDGLLELSDNFIKVTDVGRLLIRNIAMNFDGYIERKEDNARYSRTV